MKHRAAREEESRARRPHAADVEAGAKALQSGELGVFPTETVYGLGANALDETAVAKIFEAKGRPADNPLIVHLHERDQLASVVATVPEVASVLFGIFSPGPLTLVLPASQSVTRSVTAGLATVAVRFPRHPIARELLRSSRLPVAAPSANRSGEPSPTTLAMSRESLGTRVGIYIDGGPCEVGLESTVAACTENQVTILRPGAVTASDIRAALPGVEVLHVFGEEHAGIGADARRGAAITPPSPGLKHRHYQPSVPVYTWQPGPLRERRIRFPSVELDQLLERGNAGVICRRNGALASYAVGGYAPSRLTRVYADLEEYARMLYLWFYQIDRERPEAIVAEMPEDAGIGLAIRDRLTRAARGSL